MRFDTHPGGTPLPVLEHSLPDCPCGHSDEFHEVVEATAGESSTTLVICVECDDEE